MGGKTPQSRCCQACRCSTVSAPVPTPVAFPAASELFVKVNFPPYLLGLDLAGPISDQDAKASFLGTNVVLTLPKAEPGTWASLQAEGLDKAGLRERRTASMEKRRAEDEELSKARRQRKQEASDLAFRRQMAIENAEREQLEARKAEEKAAAERDVYQSLARVQAEASAAKRGLAAAPAGTPGAAGAHAAPAAGPSAGGPAAGPGGSEAKRAGEEEEAGAASGESKEAVSQEPAAPAGPKVVYLPAPRREAGTARVAIRFSERAFPTPMRQSKKGESGARRHGGAGKTAALWPSPGAEPRAGLSPPLPPCSSPERCVAPPPRVAPSRHRLRSPFASLPRSGGGRLAGQEQAPHRRAPPRHRQG